MVSCFRQNLFFTLTSSAILWIRGYLLHTAVTEVYEYAYKKMSQQSQYTSIYLKLKNNNSSFNISL